MSAERLENMRAAERWIAWVRVGGLAFAIFQIGVLRDEYPPRYEAAAWITTAVLAAGAALFFWLARRPMSERAHRATGFAALVLDSAVVSAYVLIYSFEPGTPIRQLLFIPLVEAAVRYGLVGGVGLAFALAPVYVAFAWMHADRVPAVEFDPDQVTFPVGVQVLTGLIVGWLVNRVRAEQHVADARAAEAERLRDEAGRRVGVLDAANRCAHALSSSLELERAFAAFIEELARLVRFDRLAIVLADGAEAHAIASVGVGSDTVLTTGSRRPIAGSLLEEVLTSGRTVYRPDLLEGRREDEHLLAELGLRARIAAPLVAGTHTIGMLSIVRNEPDSFTPEEIELVSLLGRLVATTVQNIRSYEAERRTVDELRRLSAMRADFVSLVSHEMRSPMAAVVGSARTLEQRWRELRPEQRDAFLALIADETSRLAGLIGDVLDTSRIEAGTFTYAFGAVDVGDVVRDAVARASLAQHEVALRADVHEPLPPVRGDSERLRQIVDNLVDNAVKYSPGGAQVNVSASAHDGVVRVDVHDDGPGIAPEQQGVIFEKFGRASGDGQTKPGSGLGLFIARSIAEAHGGTVEVRSAPTEGTTFTLVLPADRAEGGA